MLIRFHGADRTVTGSCHIVETNGLRFLLDFGLFQGNREEARIANSKLPEVLVDRSADGGIDAVILSHGHLDHCGRLPLLRRCGFKGPIYCTPATAEVARVVLLDAAKIQEEDAEYLNRRERDPRDGQVRPLFTTEDVQAVLPLFRTIPYNTATALSSEVSVTLHDAGHILGSAYVLLKSREPDAVRSLLFTADIGRYGSPIIRDPYDLSVALSAAGLTHVDALISEATYGSVTHAPMDQIGPQLLTILKETIARGGRVLLPSFAVGRTQTMLWYVQRFMQQGLIPQIPIFVDSPMGAEVSRITTKYADLFDDETRRAVCDPPTSDHCDLFGFSRVSFTVTSEESRQINKTSGPAVIIASSPTCEFGRILHHLKRSVENPNDTVVFVGWTPPHTLGRRLQETSLPMNSGGVNAQREPRKLRILDRFYSLRCQVRTLHGLSAHADGNELLRFLKPTLSPSTTAFVVHGEADRCDTFAARLSGAGVRMAMAPATQTTATVGQGRTTTDKMPTATDE